MGEVHRVFERPNLTPSLGLASQAMEHDTPPPYDAESHGGVHGPPMVNTSIFILVGQSIHTETTDSPPAYQLSRAVTSLTKSTDRVEFKRLDQIISANSVEGAPTVRRRRRHLYDLRRTAEQPRLGFHKLQSSSKAPEYFLYSRSSRRQTLGHVGLCKSPDGGFAAGFTAVPVNTSEGPSQARFVEHGTPLFTLQRNKDRSQWVSAREDETVAIEDRADTQQRLILTMAMPRKDVDTLVALWCCSIWQTVAARTDKARNDAGSSKLGSMIIKSGKSALFSGLY